MVKKAHPILKQIRPILLNVYGAEQASRKSEPFNQKMAHILFFVRLGSIACVVIVSFPRCYNGPGKMSLCELWTIKSATLLGRTCWQKPQG